MVTWILYLVISQTLIPHPSMFVSIFDKEIYMIPRFTYRAHINIPQYMAVSLDVVNVEGPAVQSKRHGLDTSVEYGQIPINELPSKQSILPRATPSAPESTKCRPSATPFNKYFSHYGTKYSGNHSGRQLGKVF